MVETKYQLPNRKDGFIYWRVDDDGSMIWRKAEGDDLSAQTISFDEACQREAALRDARRPEQS